MYTHTHMYVSGFTYVCVDINRNCDYLCKQL